MSAVITPAAPATTRTPGSGFGREPATGLDFETQFAAVARPAAFDGAGAEDDDPGDSEFDDDFDDEFDDDFEEEEEVEEEIDEDEFIVPAKPPSEEEE